MSIKFISNLFQIILWSVSFILSLIWIFCPNPTFEPEPLTFAIGLIAAASSAILKKYNDKLEQEKFCTANALAVGYVNNFIEPILTQLIKNNKNSKLYIFIPEKLSDLYPKNIDRLIAELKVRNLSNKTINVKLDEGRGVRDIMSIINANGDNVYLDFPSTLLTLNILIDYKIESKKNSFNEKEKARLGKLYIAKFKETTQTLLEEKNLLPKHVEFSNSLNQVPV